MNCHECWSYCESAPAANWKVISVLYRYTASHPKDVLIFNIYSWAEAKGTLYCEKKSCCDSGPYPWLFLDWKIIRMLSIPYLSQQALANRWLLSREGWWGKIFYDGMNNFKSWLHSQEKLDLLVTLSKGINRHSLEINMIQKKHFCTIFKGWMLVHSEKFPMGFLFASENEEVNTVISWHDPFSAR